MPATHVAITALLVYALARYLLGARHYDEFEQYLLQQPLGYANAVGILSVLGLLLALGIVAGASAGRGSRGRRRKRAGACARRSTSATARRRSSRSASASRSSRCSRRRRVRVLAAGAVAPARRRDRRRRRLGEPLRRDRRDAAHPRLGGRSSCRSRARRSRPPPSRASRFRPRSRRHAGCACSCSPPCSSSRSAARPRSRVPARPSRARRTTTSRGTTSSSRIPLLGTGAGTFGRYWAASGKALDLGGALDAHSLYLETLAELGPLGLSLLLAMLLAPLRGALARRRTPYVPAAVGAYAAFLVHAGLDWDWELPAVVVAALCCAGAVAAAELEPGRPLGRAVRGALLAVSAALAACAIAGARSQHGSRRRPGNDEGPAKRGPLADTRLKRDATCRVPWLPALAVVATLAVVVALAVLTALAVAGRRCPDRRRPVSPPLALVALPVRRLSAEASLPGRGRACRGAGDAPSRRARRP